MYNLKMLDIVTIRHLPTVTPVSSQASYRQWR